MQKVQKEKEESTRSLITQKRVITLIDPKRGQNAGIGLARIKLSTEEIRDSIRRMDETIFTLEQLKNLKEYLPTQDEIILLQNYKGDFELLAKPEKYMSIMMECPMAAKRMDVMMYKQQFKNRVTDVKSMISTIENASDDIKMSLKFKKVLKTILKVGNSLNDKEQKGFSIDSLSKLSSAKAFDNKTSVLQYIVMVIHKNEQACLSFPEELNRLSDAAKFTKEIINSEINLLKKELNISIKSMEDIIKYETLQNKPGSGASIATPMEPNAILGIQIPPTILHMQQFTTTVINFMIMIILFYFILLFFFFT